MTDHTNALTTGHQPELLTLAEAADLLRAPVAPLRYWRHRNIGSRSFRLGRRVLYRREDLRAWIDAQHRQQKRRQSVTRVPPGPGCCQTPAAG